MAEIKIGNHEFRSAPLSAKDAYRLLAEMIRLAGPGAQFLPAIVYKATESQDSSLLADVGALTACSAMLSQHGADAFVEFKRSVIESTEIKQASGSYLAADLDRDFIGDLQGAEKLFDFVIEAQFGNFSKGSEANGPVGLAITLIKNLFRVQK